jgi:uncharacterized protein (DUF4415 family)
MSAKRNDFDPMEAKLAALPEPDLTDPDNPEWTEETFTRARPAREVLSDAVLAQFKRAPGRPKSQETKIQVTLRLSPKVIAYFKADDPAGWQQRLSAALEKVVERRG